MVAILASLVCLVLFIVDYYDRRRWRLQVQRINRAWFEEHVEMQRSGIRVRAEKERAS